MSIHLHKYIESINSGGALAHENIPARIISDILCVFKKEGPNAMCFDMGDMSAYVGMKPIPELCRSLPFETCWFEVMNDGMRVGVLCRQNVHCILLFPVFDGCIAHHILYDNITSTFSAHSLEADSAEGIVNAIMVFLSVLNCKNVKTEEVKPDAALQKARAKRGKMPLFSYHVLTLRSDSSAKGENKGGTHASPRLHIRRGHIRRFDDGTHTWVSPCTVGDKSLGMVHKDYKYAAKSP